ncbi:MAG: M20/M25/M40 family metallo-hydrolase, partial [Roseomonas sp.]|nr:M20/M25/M40 family metallo-hydrolase [Roseomonas sp.]
VHLVGEARSTDADFAVKITEAFEAAFNKARGEVKDADGDMAEVTFQTRTAYPPFLMSADDPAVQRAKKAAQSMGLEPVTMVSAGGLDANWLVKHGVPTVTFGAGQAEIHTVHEYVDVPEFAQGCRLAVAIATLE